jgi:hypothetical protein
MLFCGYMDEVYVSLLNIISQKVVPHFYVFGPKSLSVYLIQSSWEQQLAVATYSASVVV